MRSVDPSPVHSVGLWIEQTNEHTLTSTPSPRPPVAAWGDPGRVTGFQRFARSLELEIRSTDVERARCRIDRNRTRSLASRFLVRPLGCPRIIGQIFWQKILLKQTLGAGPRLSVARPPLTEGVTRRQGDVTTNKATARGDGDGRSAMS